MTGHLVRLPHPSGTGPTVGTCDCGWTVSYEWGQHERAADDAASHIEAEALARPIEARTVAGEIRVLSGRSL